MSSFWPKGLSLDDTQSPYEVIESAREEWESKTAGALTLVLQRTKTESGNAMIIVHAKHVASNRTVTLFSVIHRPSEPYPATIQPRKDELPDILKRSRYVPGFGEVEIATYMQGRTVTNEWVSDTPSEFREKLIKAFNLSGTKTAILGLTSDVSSGTPEDDGNMAQDKGPAE